MSVSQKVLQSIQENNTAVIAAAFFTLLGASVAASKVFSLLKLVFDIFIRPGKSLKSFGAGKGAWAIVTGASDGIGKEFAYQLAAAKFNVLLISRTQSKLEDISKELELKNGVETKIYSMDFTQGNPQDYRKLKDIINELDVGVLINNVASNHSIPTPFVLESEEVIHNIVETNIAGLLKITKIVAPLMSAKRRGLIINIGSFSGYVPTPTLSVYSASKAFMSTFSAALGVELQSSGVLVQCINTYFVATAMSKIRRSSWLIPYPKAYVKSVLSKIGVPGGAADIPFGSNAYPSHALVNWIIGNTLTTNFWLQKNYAVHLDIRKRALRKREREAAAAKNH
ncbi:hypothetical protein G9A89_007270 [Geosiphon pyriformis]|nr:hypothetical protein G9A89_007270 [Geosiphon pyriformis]